MIKRIIEFFKERKANRPEKLDLRCNPLEVDYGRWTKEEWDEMDRLDDFKERVLNAKTEHEVDEAFTEIYDAIYGAKDLKDVDDLLAWALQPEVLKSLDLGLILAFTRLPFMKMDLFSNYPLFLNAADEELKRRGEDSKELLVELL